MKIRWLFSSFLSISHVFMARVSACVLHWFARWSTLSQYCVFSPVRSFVHLSRQLSLCSLFLFRFRCKKKTNLMTTYQLAVLIYPTRNGGASRRWRKPVCVSFCFRFLVNIDRYLGRKIPVCTIQCVLYLTFQWFVQPIPPPTPSRIHPSLRSTFHSIGVNWAQLSSVSSYRTKRFCSHWIVRTVLFLFFSIGVKQVDVSLKIFLPVSSHPSSDNNKKKILITKNKKKKKNISVY